MLRCCCVVFIANLPRAFLASCTRLTLLLLLLLPTEYSSDILGLATHSIVVLHDNTYFKPRPITSTTVLHYQASLSALYPLEENLLPLPWSFTGLDWDWTGLDWILGCPLVSACHFPPSHPQTAHPAHPIHPICSFSSHFKPFHSVQFNHFRPLLLFFPPTDPNRLTNR